MSNLLYNSGRQDFGSGVRSWPNNNIRFQLVSASYVFDSAHATLVDVPAGTRLLAAQLLTAKTITDGYAVSAPVLFENATSGEAAAACIMYYEDPSLIEANHRLVFFADQVSGFPATLNGQDEFFSGLGPNGSWFRL